MPRRHRTSASGAIYRRNGQCAREILLGALGCRRGARSSTPGMCFAIGSSVRIVSERALPGDVVYRTRQ